MPRRHSIYCSRAFVPRVGQRRWRRYAIYALSGTFIFENQQQFDGAPPTDTIWVSGMCWGGNACGCRASSIRLAWTE